MKFNRPGLPIAAGFFLMWLCILYLGADHPTPRGFAWVVVLALVAALLVYLRVPTYADWHAARWPHRVLWVLRDGALVGLAFATVTQSFSVARLGSAAAVGWQPALVWLVVLTLVGAMNTVILYAVISLGRRKGEGPMRGTGSDA